MTTLLDGPCQGVKLALKRSPPLLRVVQNGGFINALDQLQDEPDETEIIFIYSRVSRPTAWTHASPGRIPVCDYRFLAFPPDACVRETESWRLWSSGRGMELRRAQTPHPTT